MNAAVDEFEFFFEKAWSDGLPVVAPTEERIARMLDGSARHPEEVLGEVPPADEEASVRTVAIHAVMAGCKPEYLPVVIAGMEAVLDERFNMNGIQGTMHSCAPLMIVNGPYAKEIGLHGGSGCFGPGFRANATIGRAIRLMLFNLGGGIPGVVSMTTFSQPSRYTFCIAENEADSPWEPLSESRGFAPGENVLTVVACENPQITFDDTSSAPERMLVAVADTMSHMGSLNTLGSGDIVVAMGPEHARLCAKAGLSKADVRGRLTEMAGRRIGDLKRGGGYREERVRALPFPVDMDDDDVFIPTVKHPDCLHIIVAGGIPGPISMVLHGWNASSRPVSKKIEV
ncbi:MAG: hypothetical protein V3V62_00595 [bacterium]